MAGPSSLKTLNSIHLFSIKPPPPPPPPPPPSSSSLTSMKLKTRLQTFIFSHMHRVARAVSRAKSVLSQVLKDIHPIHLVEFPLRIRNKSNKQKKLFFGSFRLHYNWCSSHQAVPVALESYSSSNAPPVYYDSSWSSVVPTKTKTKLEYDGTQDSNELSRYLEWLEEKGGEDCSSNEIDRLAELFIANCHEKFRLEKVESYRRFQEMMARSV